MIKSTNIIIREKGFMGKKASRVRYTLDSKNIENLPIEEIKVILRGADELIMSGGRTLLAKILKGSRDKKVLELQLDNSPVYGYFKMLKIEDILAKIDWCIENHYLDIEYDYRLPLLVYSKQGWEIEKDIYSDELFEKINGMCFTKQYDLLVEFKDKNREVIMMLLDKIEDSGSNQYIPVLKVWRKIDYKKVQKRIDAVIRNLERKIKQ